MRPFSSKAISTGSNTCGSAASSSTWKSSLRWKLLRESCGERAGAPDCFFEQARRVSSVTSRTGFKEAVIRTHYKGKAKCEMQALLEITSENRVVHQHLGAECQLMRRVALTMEKEPQ